MTQVPTTRSETTNVPKYQLVKCKATRTQHKTRSPSILHPAKKAADNAALNLLLPFNRDNSAIMISSLLLPCNSTHQAIMTSTNANFSSQLIVETSSLLLLCNFERPAIMMALNKINRLPSFFQYNLAIMIALSLQLIVETFSTGAKQASVCIDSFKLIDVLASEGAMFAPNFLKTLSMVQTNLPSLPLCLNKWFFQQLLETIQTAVSNPKS
jgi:hypothetical protein